MMVLSDDVFTVRMRLILLVGHDVGAMRVDDSDCQ
jgi:hypothetical protein